MLVVIAIISVLIALLLPVAMKARIASQKLVCVSNLRQQYTAHLAYMADHNGWLLHARPNGGWPEFWVDPANTPYNPASPTTRWNNLDYIERYFGMSRKAFNASYTNKSLKAGCLSCPTRSPQDHKYSGGFPPIDYIWNGEVMTNAMSAPYSPGSGYGYGRDYPIKLSWVHHPSLLFLVMCSMQVENGRVEIAPAQGQVVGWTWNKAAVVSTYDVAYQTFPHALTTNYIAFDGHVESMPYTMESLNKLGGTASPSGTASLATWTNGGIFLEKY